MKQLNATATRLFINILAHTAQSNDVTVHRLPYSPVQFEKWGKVNTKEGGGYFFSITLYNKDNPKEIDIRMSFIVVDNGDTVTRGHGIIVYPVLYQNETENIDEASCTIKEGQIDSYKPKWQSAHAKVAAKLLDRLHKEGFTR